MARRLGSKICIARKQRGFTQHQLAQIVNADVSTINKIENDKANPSLVMLDRIAIALGITASKLLEDDLDPTGTY